LRADGAAIPAKIPLLANHSRASLDDILGSAREIRREGTDIVARLFFAEGDDDAERAWNKVKQGHLDSVSVGYRATEYVDIPAGQSNTVAGKRYTASPERPLRVTTRWIPKEVSAVPIGADPAAKMRDEKTPTDTRNQESPDMDPKLRAFLEQHGLRSDATDDEAVAFMAALGGNLRARAEAIERGEDDPGEPPAANRPPTRRSTTSAARRRPRRPTTASGPIRRPSSRPPPTRSAPNASESPRSAASPATTATPTSSSG